MSYTFNCEQGNRLRFTTALYFHIRTRTVIPRAFWNRDNKGVCVREEAGKGSIKSPDIPNSISQSS